MRVCALVGSGRCGFKNFRFPLQSGTHLYCIGTTGQGKSKFLENLLVQDITAGRGCGLVESASFAIAPPPTAQACRNSPWTSFRSGLQGRRLRAPFYVSRFQALQFEPKQLSHIQSWKGRCGTGTHRHGLIHLALTWPVPCRLTAACARSASRSSPRFANRRV
jgi:hypothetical protein